MSRIGISILDTIRDREIEDFLLEEKKKLREAEELNKYIEPRVFGYKNQYNTTIRQVKVNYMNKTYQIGSFTVSAETLTRKAFNEKIEELKSLGFKEVKRPERTTKKVNESEVGPMDEDFILNNTFNIYKNKKGEIEGLEAWTDGGVDMYLDIEPSKPIEEQLEKYLENFDIDDEIDLYREDKNYREHFRITDSVRDFEAWQKQIQGVINDLKEVKEKNLKEDVDPAKEAFINKLHNFWSSYNEARGESPDKTLKDRIRALAYRPGGDEMLLDWCRGAFDEINDEYGVETIEAPELRRQVIEEHPEFIDLEDAWDLCNWYKDYLDGSITKEVFLGLGALDEAMELSSKDYTEIVEDTLDGTDFILGSEVNVEGNNLVFNVTAYDGEGKVLNREVKINIAGADDKEVRNRVEDWMSNHSTPDVFYESYSLGDDEDSFRVYRESKKFAKGLVKSLENLGFKEKEPGVLVRGDREIEFNSIQDSVDMIYASINNADLEKMGEELGYEIVYEGDLPSLLEIPAMGSTDSVAIKLASPRFNKKEE